MKSSSDKSFSCPLCCNNCSEIFYNVKNRVYILCNNCYGIFLIHSLLPSEDFEIARYKQHNNDVNDIRFQNFVSPIVNHVLKDFSKKHKGIDFGAGTGPVITEMLRDKDYNIKAYDPFFHNYPHLLNQKYDYITCCEVVEHFHNPKKEFELLSNLLNPNGVLYIMTSIYHSGIDFKSWYYKDDPTHVFFYQKETIEYIHRNHFFSSYKNEGNLIVFTR